MTVTISGEVPAGEWYGIKNVSLEASQAVKNAPITVRYVEEYKASQVTKTEKKLQDI